jgi:hypothetical protein
LQDGALPEPGRSLPRPGPTYSWPSRAAAGVAAAALTAWLTAHLLAPMAIAPATAALIAGGLIAALPRLGWLALTAALTIAAALQHRPGGALALLTAGLMPAALMPLSGALWPLPAAAPGLGAIGLAGAWPAVAGRAATVWQRVGLGAIGWVWLLIATQLAQQDLYIAATKPTQAWTASLHEATHGVLGPMISSGLLAPAVVWAAGAAVLPWLVRGRSLPGDIVRAVIWAAIVASATIALVHRSHGIRTAMLGHGTRTPTTAVLGAVVCGIVAVIPTIVNAGRSPRELP